MNKKRYIMPKAKAVKLENQSCLISVSQTENSVKTYGMEWGDKDDDI